MADKKQENGSFVYVVVEMHSDHRSFDVSWTLDKAFTTKAKATEYCGYKLRTTRDEGMDWVVKEVELGA